MYQTNIVQGPTALSVLVATIDYPWYLHSVVTLTTEKFLVIQGYRKGKDEPVLPSLTPAAVQEMWSRG
jgi:hypothetical protein